MTAERSLSCEPGRAHPIQNKDGQTSGNFMIEMFCLFQKAGVAALAMLPVLIINLISVTSMP
jgi:hypothetical protein